MPGWCESKYFSRKQKYYTFVNTVNYIFNKKYNKASISPPNKTGEKSNFSKNLQCESPT